MSGRESIYSQASIFLDHVLRRFAIKTSSYIRNTNDFLEKRKTVELPTNVILASFDVIIVYMSIDVQEGSDAVRHVLQNEL